MPHYSECDTLLSILPQSGTLYCQGLYMIVCPRPPAQYFPSGHPLEPELKGIAQKEKPHGYILKWDFSF
jgi:hypothetical protein